jgi:hypothetical protein
MRLYVFIEGDDCISIVGGSNNVEAIDVACGPGHGIQFVTQLALPLINVSTQLLG